MYNLNSTFSNFDPIGMTEEDDHYFVDHGDKTAEQNSSASSKPDIPPPRKHSKSSEKVTNYI